MAAHRWVFLDKNGKFVYIHELNPPIIQTARAIAHILDRHTHNGIARYVRKSKFSIGEDIANLIARAVPYPMVLQPSGRYARTYSAGRIIGYDSTTGAMTDLVTVITDVSGELTTAFPGRP